MSVTADPRSAILARSALVVLLTAGAYAAVGLLSLQLALTGGIASPIFPAAGIALASTMVFGVPGAIGTALGAFVMNGVHASLMGAGGPQALVGVPAGIAIGAAMQAMLGTALAERAAGHPAVLREPNKILRFAGYAGVLGCLLNATWSTALLTAAGTISSEAAVTTWWTWWTGDTLGVLIGTPIALTFIGRPRDEWAPRRTSVGLPMLLGTLLLAAASTAFHRQEQARTRAAFEDSANSAAETVAGHLEESMHVLQAIHGAFASQPDGRRPALRPVADWWLRHSAGVRAIGYSERVARDDVTVFESRARAEGLPDYRVFDRPDSGGTTAADKEVVAIRAIEPARSNLAALGVNALSIPAAREAILGATTTGSAVSTRGFRLTQAESADSVGVVVYRALYQGVPADETARRDQWRGVVFVTLELDRVAQAAMTRLQTPLHWCMVEPALAPDLPRRLAGPVGCERPAKADLTLSRPLAFAGQSWEMRLWAHTKDVPGGSHAGTWLFSLVGLVATAMLGLLLLTVTGRARRIELAVEERTQALSDEIGERRVAEDALRDSEQRLRSILDHVPIGVVFMDVQGRILDSNPSMCRMLQRSADELSRLTVRDLTHPDEHGPDLEAARGLISGAARVVGRQIRLLRRDGSILPARASLSALRDVRGGGLRLVGVVEDITEHLRLAETERARDQAEAANRAKTDFVSRMSHELRTPLNAMLGFAQLLGMDQRPPLAPHQAGWTTQIQHAGWHLLDMINDTLDLSRIESGLVQLKEQTLELRPTIDACLALLSNAAERRGVRVEVNLHPAAHGVTADETRLKQVLTNLLSNAIKYNQDGGQVRIESAPTNDGMVEIRVVDTGIGLSAAQLAALFQPYNRLGRENTLIEGTGIGLVISRRLAELMGGTLEAQSVETEGATFTVRLPQARFTVTGTPVDGAIDLPPPHYRRRVVHYIEDNETNIEVMRGILSQRPQVELAVSMSGLDGLAAVREHRPDLILLDMHLPDIGGLELLRHLKHDDAVADIPVLVLSADATPWRIEEALTLGAMYYLTKPVDVTGFVHVLDEVLSELDTRWN